MKLGKSLQAAMNNVLGEIANNEYLHDNLMNLSGMKDKSTEKDFSSQFPVFRDQFDCQVF